MRYFSAVSSIKTKLLISFLFLVLIVGVLFSIVHLFFSLEQSSIQKKLSLSTLNEAFKDYYSHNDKVLKALPVQYAVNNSNYISKLMGDFFHTHKNATGKEEYISSFLNGAMFSLNDRPVMTYSLVNTNGDLLYNGFMSVSKAESEIVGYSDLIKNIVSTVNRKKIFSGYVRDKNISNGSKDFFVFSQRIEDTNFILISFTDTRYYTNELYGLHSSNTIKKIDKVEYLFNRNMQTNLERILWISILLFVLLFLISSFISFLLALRLSNPIVELKDAALRLGDGNFDVKIKEKGSSELVQVAKTFNDMGERLKNYMSRLEDEISFRKSSEAEMNIAKNIQNAVLPHPGDEFCRREFKIVSKLSAAQFIAGDFFDYFYLNDNKSKIAVIIGDVSGKGVPAAFFMGILLTTLRNFGNSGLCKTPGELLNEVNKKMCINNPENMFATIVAMYYDLNDGVLEYSIAGHHESFYVSNNNSDITTFGYNGESQLLGLFQDSDYLTEKMILNVGDAIISYTDGVTDAQTPSGEFFEYEKLYTSIRNKVGKISDEELIDQIFSDVTSFQNGQLFDDMTMIMLRRTSIAYT